MTNFFDFKYLIEKYENSLKQNPHSRVFAPLGEAHRKAGNIDEAISILKQGVRSHPGYAYGYICLAECYVDIKQFQVAYSLLKPLVEDHRENFKLLSVYAFLCEELEKYEEALESYKFLLFLNPKDEKSSQKVAHLENKDKKLLSPLIDEDDKELEEDSWKEVNLGLIQEEKVKDELEIEFEKINDEALEEKENQVGEVSEKQNDEPKEDLNVIEFNKEEDLSPVITHTLVDLYLNQGHKDKAIEILDKIIENNPDDQKSIDKRDLLVDKSESDEENQDSLMSYFDEKISSNSNKGREVVSKLELFLEKVQEKASSRARL